MIKILWALIWSKHSKCSDILEQWPVTKSDSFSQITVFGKTTKLCKTSLSPSLETQLHSPHELLSPSFYNWVRKKNLSNIESCYTGSQCCWTENPLQFEKSSVTFVSSVSLPLSKLYNWFSPSNPFPFYWTNKVILTEFDQYKIYY